MVSFVTYDLIFLGIFVLATVLFLYSRRNNLKRQGLLYLYRTKIGIDFIENFVKRHGKMLRKLEYVVIASGCFLMVAIIYLLIKLSYNYITSPTLAQNLKIPVLMPLVPYIGQIFNIDFLPPFYFTYWIIIIAVIAIPHEFAHGIFARLNKIKVRSTGFGFLGPFLAAFVEPDEKQTEKASKKAQLSILAAGTFANILATIVFSLLILVFFFAFFSPTGVYFNSYAVSQVNISQIDTIEGIPLSKFNMSEVNKSLIEIDSNGNRFFTTSDALNYSLSNNKAVLAYDDAPAFKANLAGDIIKVDNTSVNSYDKLRSVLDSHKPGDNISITTLGANGTKVFDLQLSEKDGKAFLGIGRSVVTPSAGLLSFVYSKVYLFIDPLKYQRFYNGIAYTSSIGDFGIFVYNLLWWLVLINLSVAFMNMLPLGLFDGGRFFMLSVWGITGSKKIGEKAFKVSTYFFLLLLAALMVKWAFAVLI